MRQLRVLCTKILTSREENAGTTSHSVDIYGKEVILQMCKEAYKNSRVSSSQGSPFPENWSYEYHYSELYLEIAPRRLFSKADIVECRSDKADTFYMTKGRRSNSIYFVKRVTNLLAQFVLDENFRCDIDLSTDFAALALSIIRNNIRNPDEELWV